MTPFTLTPLASAMLAAISSAPQPPTRTQLYAVLGSNPPHADAWVAEAILDLLVLNDMVREVDDRLNVAPAQAVDPDMPSVALLLDRIAELEAARLDLTQFEFQVLQAVRTYQRQHANQSPHPDSIAKSLKRGTAAVEVALDGLALRGLIKRYRLLRTIEILELGLKALDAPQTRADHLAVLSMQEVQDAA